MASTAINATTISSITTVAAAITMLILLVALLIPIQLLLPLEDFLMGFQDVVFLTSRASFLSPHFLRIAVEVKASGPLHVLKLWLGVSKCMLPVNYFCSNKVAFVSVLFHEDHKTVT